MRAALNKMTSERVVSPRKASEETMYTKSLAPETGGTGSPVADVGDDLTALRKDVAALATDVGRLATYGPELAHESYAAAVRRNPVQATVIAAAVGFVVCLIIAR